MKPKNPQGVLNKNIQLITVCLFRKIYLQLNHVFGSVKFLLLFGFYFHIALDYVLKPEMFVVFMYFLHNFAFIPIETLKWEKVVNKGL